MNFDQYVGLPYLDNGRDKNGCDCWGLVRVVFAEQANILLPCYSDQYRTAEDDVANAALIARHLDPWVEVEPRTAKALDCLLMTFGGIECHIGIVVQPGYVLHVGMLMSFSRIESYRSMRIKKRISRFMRHRTLT